MNRFAPFALLALCACAQPEVRKDPAAECRSTTDCPAGQTCVRGMCEDTTPTLRCIDDPECPSGQACINGYCQTARSNPNQPPPRPGPR